MNINVSDQPYFYYRTKLGYRFLYSYLPFPSLLRSSIHPFIIQYHCHINNNKYIYIYIYKTLVGSGRGTIYHFHL